MTLETALFLSLLFHFIGDYIIQSDWMANEKIKSNWPAFIHAVSYSGLFFIICDWQYCVGLILLTHFFIDRFRLAKYVVYFKNLFSPAAYRYKWSDCSATGYHKDRPAWLAVWLLIIADNIMHVCLNTLAIVLTYKGI